jgi:hypothetical protein
MRELVTAGAIGTPTLIRVKTVVGHTGAPPRWTPLRRRHAQVRHGAVARERALAGSPCRRPQGKAFLRAPMAALFEYERDDLLGVM